MKNLILAFLVLFTSKAYSLCAPTSVAEKLGCEVVGDAKFVCQNDYGGGVAVLEKGACTPKNVAAAIKAHVPSGILGQVKAASDEIDAILTMIDRKGQSNGLMNFKVAEVRTFHESSIEALLEKMSDLREKSYLLSVSVGALDSKLGKQAIIYAARYYSFMSRIHQILATAAHTGGANLSYDQLKKFTLKVDKRVGLEILARMNLKARHLDSETLKIVVSEEEKQNFEFNVLQSPTTLPQYAKLIQFMSIREYFNNKWALARMSEAVLDDPAVGSCGPGILSFRPGADGRISSSNVMNELFSFDIYFNRYAKLIDNLVAASKKVNIMTDERAGAIMDRVEKSVPSYTKRLIDEYGYTPDEIVDWKKAIAATLEQNEAAEWDLYSKPTISVAVFPGDKVDPKEIEERVVDDTFNLRKDAVIAQLTAMMNDFTPEETTRMQKSARSYLESHRAGWEKSMRALVAPVVAGVDDILSFKRQNYLDKLAQTKEAGSSALSAASFQLYVNATDADHKKFNKPKLPYADLEPKSPQELVELFQQKLVKNASLNYVVDSNAERRKLVQGFFQRISEKFAKLDAKLGVAGIQKKLLEIANAEAIALGKKYPAPAPVIEPVAKFRYEPKIIAVDNTYVKKPVYNPYVKATVSEDGTGSLSKPVSKPVPKPILPETSRATTDSLRTNYHALSMTRFQPMVADNTRVAVNRYIPEVKEESIPKTKNYNVNLDDVNYMVNDWGFVERFLRTLNLSAYGGATGFHSTIGDQWVIADMRLAVAYNASALLKIPLARTVTKVQGLYSRTPTEVDVTTEEPTMIRMAMEAYTHNQKTGTGVVNDVKLTGLVQEVIRKAIANQKNQTTAICKADHTRPGSDDNYKTLFRSATFVRQGLLSDDALSKAVASRLNKLDQALQKETRYWHEKINEDWIQPMTNAAMVIFIVSALIIPMLGSAGILAPGSVMLAMTLLDGVDLALTGASLYFRSVSTFIEIPAQVKFQRALATTQVENFSLTSWDDVKAAEASSKMAKTMLIAFTPLDALVGGQFYFSAKKLVGLSGKAALKRAGVAARGFGQPPRSMVPNLSMKEMIRSKGVVKGTIAKTAQEIKNLKYWTPRYQLLTPSELSGTLRSGLVEKAKRTVVEKVVKGKVIEKSLADEPWQLIADLKASAKTLDGKLEVNKVLDTLTGKEAEQVASTGRIGWKEFLNKPTYSKEYLVPKNLIVAFKNGKLTSYLENWGSHLTAMNRLRGQYLNKRKKLIETLIAKLEDVQNMALTNKNFLTENAKANHMEHFIGLLSDKEIKALRDIAKVSSGSMSQFRKVFKDHEVILESIVSFTTVSGKNLTKSGTSYARMLASEDDKQDLVNMYLNMLDDNSAELGADDLFDLRMGLENDLGL